jgi:hypothetical protein
MKCEGKERREEDKGTEECRKKGLRMEGCKHACM